MFKTFLASKFSFSNGLVLPFLTKSNNGSASIGNFIINFPAFRQNKLNAILDKANDVNIKHKKNFQQVTEREKEILKLSNWTFKKEGENSSIEKEFIFKTQYHALEFISQVKDKCDFIDHHPCWEYSSSSGVTKVKVNLTSHFAANTITDKDIYLGAYMTYKYEELLYVFNSRCSRTLIGGSLSLVVALLLISLSCNKYKNWYSNDMKKYNL